MKRVIIGDPHGRFGPIYEILYKEKPNDVIILGDYFDSFNIDAYTQRECYDKIITLYHSHLADKRGKFIMLIGNHDMHYMDEKFGRCSGWDELTNSLASYPLCRDWDKEILHMCYVDIINKTIYSHAGVSMNWFNQWIKPNGLGSINTTETKAFCFTYKNGGDWYGSSSWNSPLWIRPEGLKQSPYKDEQGVIWSQVFGHTEPNTPIHWKDGDADFYGIDCMTRAYIVEILDDKTKKLIYREIIKL